MDRREESKYDKKGGKQVWREGTSASMREGERGQLAYCLHFDIKHFPPLLELMRKAIRFFP